MYWYHDTIMGHGTNAPTWYQCPFLLHDGRHVILYHTRRVSQATGRPFGAFTL